LVYNKMAFCKLTKSFLKRKLIYIIEIMN